MNSSQKLEAGYLQSSGFYGCMKIVVRSSDSVEKHIRHALQTALELRLFFSKV